MFLVVMLPPLRREPLEVGGPNFDSLAGTTPGTVHRTSEAQAANSPLAGDVAMGSTTPLETAGATMGGMVPPDATPLVADLGPPASRGGDEIVVEAFVATLGRMQRLEAASTSFLRRPRRSRPRTRP